MSANTLVVCEPRLGWLIRGNPDIPPDTPEVAVMLRDTGTDIELTVPLSSILNPADHYARLVVFGNHENWGFGRLYRARHQTTSSAAILRQGWICSARWMQGGPWTPSDGWP